MSKSLILTTGIYDMIKDHVKRKKATPIQEATLLAQLKSAKQVTRKELPEDVVNIDTRATVKYLDTNEEEVFTFVAPDKAKRRNNTESIMSTMGLALVGYQAGDKLTWSFEEGEKEIELLKVERI
ncbi:MULTISPECIES: GreA/GreB family elongation factor [Flavobacterium]|uniref:Regulator of nucleoside diphosphate kinase n=1 Tax=Flavobacterium weaverense TaxID=271156 RepID=A0A3M0A422_9FLAO|nr:GreA/GreB family elongation factor [Flavobacterium weaverense]RMA77245.1 regulator of nucleoside diphosphate kinase [Flavobacterium weaverense]